MDKTKPEVDLKLLRGLRHLANRPSNIYFVGYYADAADEKKEQGIPLKRPAQYQAIGRSVLSKARDLGYAFPCSPYHPRLWRITTKGITFIHKLRNVTIPVELHSETGE